MTISTTDWRITYSGNGVTTVFAFPYRFLANAELKVLEVATNGTETPKTLTTHYTLTGAGDDAGGSVTMLVAPAAGVTLVIYRDTAVVQETDYISGDPFPAETHEEALDRLTMILQERVPDSGSGSYRTLVVPLGDSDSVNRVLPASVSRLDRLLAFDATTGGVEASPFTVTQVASAVAAAYAAGSTADAVTFIADGVGAVSRSVQAKLREWVSVTDFGADNTGATDCSAEVQAAFDSLAVGGTIYFPRGTYRIDSTITLHLDYFNYSSVFGPGPRIIGDGIGVTIFDNRVASGAMFDIDADTGDAHATFKALLGVLLEGFTIKTLGAPASSTAIKLRTTYLTTLRQLHIAGMSANGVEIVCSVGDNDAVNMVNIEQVRIDACAGWGIKSDAASGHNETSYVAMRQVSINGCGTASASATPPSGGMAWKGQVLTAQQCSFVTCENVGLYIPGQAGLGQCVDLQNVTFENNKKRGFYSTGVQGLRGKLLQFYNNNSYTATNAFELDGTTYTVRNVEIDGVIVRATSGNNAYTAFKISGGNAVLESCRVRRVTWDNFDHAGQTRFDGWQFDHVEAGCDLVAEDPTTLTLRPSASRPVRSNKMPYRLRGGIGGTPSTSGEIIDLEIPASGISVTPSGLPASALRYYCYLYDNNGLPSLELSTTGFVTSSIGYSVKSGDATRIYVGSVETDATPQFKLTAGGWLNPNWIPASQVGVFNAQWCDSTGDLRVKTDGSAPTSDTDGVIVGTQS